MQICNREATKLDKLAYKYRRKNGLPNTKVDPNNSYDKVAYIYCIGCERVCFYRKEK